MQSIQGVKYRFGRSTPNNYLGNGCSAPSFAVDAGALFHSNNFKGNTDTRPSHTVSIGNIPGHIQKGEILALFSTLIGEVRGFRESKELNSSRIEITFVDRDAAAKALCMNGYTVDGIPLSVSILPNFTSQTRGQKVPPDDRRNLYVLGLPFSLSKAEFAALFSQYGTVSHCVILATVDNSSRRRGFVVMSSHEEAKRAMAALTRTQTKGHSIDVSWAVVQRSQGFLDGGDRAMLLDPRSNVPTPSPASFEKKQRSVTSNSSDSAVESHDADPASLATSYIPTNSLLVTNLPTLLFSQAQDLHPLLFPFGHIEKLEIVQCSPLGTMSVLVQYAQTSVAQEAKDSLNGQVYGDHLIDVRFVRPATSPVLGFGTNAVSSDTVTNENSGHSVASAYASSRPLPRGTELSGSDRLICGASNRNQQFILDDSGTKPSGEVATSHSKKPSLSLKHSPFYNVFDDFSGNSIQVPGFPSWAVNYSVAPDHQYQRQDYPVSKHAYYHSAFQSSAA